MKHKQLVITLAFSPQPAVIYLNNAIDVKAHDKLRDVTHQIVKPVVHTCQNVDWFIVVPEKHSENVRP